MIMWMYAVYDRKALCYSTPFCAQNDAVAQRVVIGLMEDPVSLVGRHPADYQLVLVGEYNDDVGEVSRHAHRVVCDVGVLAAEAEHPALPLFKKEDV